MVKSDPASNLIHKLGEESSEEKKMQDKLPTSIFVAVVVSTLAMGIVLGFILTKLGSSQNKTAASSFQNSKKTAGIADKKTFKDKAEGRLKEGGIDGEGSFHLERPGGPSQNVYLTSSTVDLVPYIGKKIRVWGETFKAEKAGWLMDVGYIELLQ